MSMRHSLLIMISVCVANLAAAGPAEPGRESDDLNEQLRVVYGLVQNSVVRVVNQRTEGPSQGTGVLVAEREEDGQTFGYFVTCAHVISGATRALKLYRMPIDEESGTQTVAAEGSSVKFLANSDYDLAVLRVELAKPGIMRPVSIAETEIRQQCDGSASGTPRAICRRHERRSVVVVEGGSTRVDRSNVCHGPQRSRAIGAGRARP